MSGGIRALYQLKKEFDSREIESYFYNERKSDNEILIYPEIIRGNPLNSPRIVRWLLNKANFPNDICYAWETGMGKYPLLTVNIIEMDLWKPSDKTNKIAYWVGKGEFDERLVPDDAYEISTRNYTRREELAKFISSLDYLISFDIFSAINLEAVISGTPVVIHNTGNQWNPGNQSKNSEFKWSRRLIEMQNWMPYGIAWNYEELEKAKQNVHLARPHYEMLLPIFQNRVDNFIQQTQHTFS
jgi:hypothetical protein